MTYILFNNQSFAKAGLHYMNCDLQNVIRSESNNILLETSFLIKKHTPIGYPYKSKKQNGGSTRGLVIDNF